MAYVPNRYCSDVSWLKSEFGCFFSLCTYILVTYSFCACLVQDFRLRRQGGRGCDVRELAESAVEWSRQGDGNVSTHN